MALTHDNLEEWNTLQMKTETTPIPFTNRNIEVDIEDLKSVNSKF